MTAPRIVDIPFTYSMHVIRRGKRKTEGVKALSSVQVVLRDIAQDETQLVARLPYPDHFRDLPDKVDLRLHDGQLWLPKVSRGSVGQRDSVMPLDRHLEWLGKGLCEGRASARNDPDFKEITWDNEDERKEEAIELALRDILVDGVPYETTEEPYFLVTPDGYNRMRIDLHAQYHADADKTHVWRLDRWPDLARAMRRAFDGELNPYDLEKLESLKPEVLRPDLLVIEDDGPALLAGLRRCLGGLDKTFLSKATADTLLSYARLRDALASETPSLAEVADLGDDLVERLVAEDISAWQASSARDDLQRWREGKGREHDFDGLDIEGLGPAVPGGATS